MAATAACTACVIIFGGTYFKDNSAQLNVGDHVEGSWNTKVGGVSSIRVGDGAVAILYKGFDFTGTSEVITGDKDRIQLNDQVHSVRVVKAATIFGDTSYGARSMDLAVGKTYEFESWKGTVGGLSSVKVGPGVKVTLYAEAGLKGESFVVTSDTPNVGGFNDKARSISVTAQ